MARESVEGQALELDWRQRNATDLGESDDLRRVLKKTCWYTTLYPTRLGALIGTRDGVDLDRYFRFGFFVGAAFQLQDDLLNLIGDEARYGKERTGEDVKPFPPTSAAARATPSTARRSRGPFPTAA